MAHGTPDWGVTAGRVTVYQLTDLAEAVVRLGSLDTFDRRGDVLWADDFERSLNKWSPNAQGTGASVALSTARARNGRYSALLTAGSDGGLAAFITHVSPFPALSAFGMEFSFNLGSTIDLLDISVQLFDGTDRLNARIQWFDGSNDLWYQAVGGAFVSFATGVDLARTSTLFHTAKLVFNGVSRRYIRFILDNRTYDLSANALWALADATLPEASVVLSVVGRAGFNDTLYVDDVILTQNEPA